jgi:hypothetical protein
MSQVLQRTPWRMDRTVKIKVNKPCPGGTFLIKKVKHGFVALFFVKSTSCVFMVGKQRGEVFSSLKSRLNHRPCKKLKTDTTFTVYIRYLFNQVPQSLLLHPIQQ